MLPGGRTGLSFQRVHRRFRLYLLPQSLERRLFAGFLRHLERLLLRLLCFSVLASDNIPWIFFTILDGNKISLVGFERKEAYELNFAGSISVLSW